MKSDWKIEEIERLYNLPFPELLFQAQSVHRENFPIDKIQCSTLLSIKTGGCPEDCKYCPQSAHYKTNVEREKLLPTTEILESAKNAKQSGATRFCMGAAWRQVKDGPQFDSVLETVKQVDALGLEVCCTLGMLTEEQAVQLKEAGCHAYNHNLDTSPEYYEEVITTRTYDDRLRTLKNVRHAGITVCCGGIVGLGESTKDRLELLRQLAIQEPQPESVPINMLIKVSGTPYENEKDVDPIEFIRVIAVARILMPKSFVRLSAGRTQMSDEVHALCFMAGANSIFGGDTLLTTPNPGDSRDHKILQKLGMSFFNSEELTSLEENIGHISKPQRAVNE